MPPTRTYAAICEDLDRTATEWYSKRSKSLYEAIGGLLDEMAKRHHSGKRTDNPLYSPDDASQEFISGALAALPRWDPAKCDRYSQWAYIRGLGRVKDTYRRYSDGGRRRTPMTLQFIRYPMLADMENVAGVYDDPYADARLDLHRALPRLKDREHGVIQRYMTGFSNIENGLLIGMGEKMVCTVKALAIKQIREYLTTGRIAVAKRGRPANPLPA